MKKMRFRLIAVHTVAAMFGGPVLAFVALIPISLLVAAVTHLHRLELDAWYGPAIWGPALVLGFLIRRRFHQREACIVWLVGLIWIVMGLHSVKFFDHTWSRVRINLFPAKDTDCSSTECVYVLFYTWPAICSLSYSIGAYLENFWTAHISAQADKATALSIKP
jgi:hypothetical protein